MRNLIRKECGITLAVRTVGKYLKRWGYTAKKPQRHARDQIPAEVQQWLEETYPAIEKRAETENARIFWCDETGSAADEHPGFGYAREGRRATMEVPQSHIHMNQIAAISNTGAVRFMTYSRTMNAALFLVFLDRLLRSTAGKIYLIVDRLRAHSDGQCGGMGGDPPRPNRVVLLAASGAGVERGRVPEQRPEGPDQ